MARDKSLQRNGESEENIFAKTYFSDEELKKRI